VQLLEDLQMTNLNLKDTAAAIVKTALVLVMILVLTFQVLAGISMKIISVVATAVGASALTFI